MSVGGSVLCVRRRPVVCTRASLVLFVSLCGRWCLLSCVSRFVWRVASACVTSRAVLTCAGCCGCFCRSRTGVVSGWRRVPVSLPPLLSILGRAAAAVAVLWSAVRASCCSGNVFPVAWPVALLAAQRCSTFVFFCCGDPNRTLPVVVKVAAWAAWRVPVSVVAVGCGGAVAPH